MKSYLFLIFSILLCIGCNKDNKTFSNNSSTEIKRIASDSDSSSEHTMKINGSCSYDGKLLSDNLYVFKSDNKAATALEKIMKFTGLPVNFKLMAADVDNACAVLEQGDSGEILRYIMYNQAFMLQVENATQNHWAEVSILAHEIAHHLAGHTLKLGGSRPDLELEADRFSGFILYKMGASLNDAQIAIKTFGSDVGSTTHPPKKPRLLAITNGWLAAQEQSEISNTDISDKSLAVSVTQSAKDEIISTLNNYYADSNNADCIAIAGYFTPVVENYFDHKNFPSSEIVNDCTAYYKRWPYQQMNIDNSTFSISQLSNGEYFVTYNMFYQTKREIEDPWKNFNLTLNVVFTPEMKIRSMYEYQN